jgi:two-component system, repressor protein LuxO
VLLVEDTLSLQMVYRSILATAGHRVAVAATASDGLEQFRNHRPMVVLLDLILPDRDGLEVMQEIQSLQPETRVIAITANGSVNRAVEAMRPARTTSWSSPSTRAASCRPCRTRWPRPAPATPLRPSGPSAPVGDAQGRCRPGGGRLGLHRVVRADEAHPRHHRLGRPLDGHRLHHRRKRHRQRALRACRPRQFRPRLGPFIALNCGAIPQDLLESEVFGHMKGSFTGAISDKQGAATAADGGTLFLDEICEMAPALQTKLLRFLQTSTVQPVGATRPRKVNVRIVCATNRDPLDAVRRGHFREDLYYRLYVVPIHMPPCATAAATSSRSPRPRSPASPPRKAAPSTASPRCATCCARCPGPATCGNC